MEIVVLPKTVLLECKMCGCRISLTHDEWVKVLNGQIVQLCPYCKSSKFIKVGCNY